MEYSQTLQLFEEKWRLGEYPSLQDFLTEQEESPEPELLKELIAIDLEYRWRKFHEFETGLDTATHSSLETVNTPEVPEAPELNDYLSSWPKLVSAGTVPIDLIQEDFRARHRWGDRPEIQEYLERYPQYADLRQALESVLRELALDHEENPAQSPSELDLDALQDFGRYRLEKELGRGGMGHVYLAHDSQLDRQVALKIPKLDDNLPQVRERFIHEAKAAAKLRHHNICTVFDADEIDDQPFITMAYIEGVTLQQFWEQQNHRDFLRSLPILIQIAQAMQVAHEAGIIHRDLKPSNIMIDKDLHAVVMDFGLAHSASLSADGRITQSGEAVGSPAYMSPEQLEADSNRLTPSSDIYSLGVILYEALAGRRPFEGSLFQIIAAICRDEPQAPSELISNVDPELESLCLRMLEKNPERRPSSMREVAERLESILVRLQSNANAQTGHFTNQGIEDSRQPPSRKPACWLMVVAIPLFVLGVVLFRLRTPMGEVTIEVNEQYSDQISVRVLQGGKLVQVADRKSGWNLSLKEGDYHFDLGTRGEQFLIEPNDISVSAKKDRIVSIRLKPGLEQQSKSKTPGTPDSDGWTDLLPDSTLSLWQPMLTKNEAREAQQEAEGGWSVQDGILLCETAEPGWLKLKEAYQDFEFELEYRLPADGNSGVIFRSTGSGILPQNSLEAQIIDDQWSKGNLRPTTRSGALYGLIGPTKSVAKPAGEWNQMRLKCQAGQIEIELNGTLTAIHELSGSSLNSKSGRNVLGLWNYYGQAKGTAFRNLRLRPLKAASEPDQEKSSGPAESKPSRNLALYFDGIDDHVITPIKYDGSHPITIEAWVAPVHPWRDSLIMQNTWGTSGIEMLLSGNSRNQPTWSSAVYRESFTPNPNHYLSKTDFDRTHLAYVWDGNQSRFYINGDASDEKLKGHLADPPASDHVFRFGMPPSKKEKWRRLHGYMDEMRFSKVARYIAKFDPPERHEVDSDTIALYHCDEESTGLILRDASGNGNDAEIFGAVRKPAYEMHAPGQYYRNLDAYERNAFKDMTERTSPALRFTITNAAVKIPEIDFDFGEPFTAEFWGTPESDWTPHDMWGRIAFAFGKSDVRISVYEDRWTFHLWDGESVRTDVLRKHTLRLKHRTHIAAQWNGEHLELFVNGQPVPGPETAIGSFRNLKQRTIELLQSANNHSLSLGSWGKNGQFGGEIDSFRLSKVARYQQADAPEERPVPFEPQELEADEQTLILYDFHEGEGDVLHDLSGNDYHGEISPEAIWVPAPPKVKPLPGLIAEPQAEEGIRRSQVITRWPRAEPCHHTFSPDGKLYALASRDGYVRLFEGGAEGTLKSVIHIREQKRYQPFGMHWAADSKMFFTATYDWVQIWSIEGKLLHEWQYKLTDIEWHPSENILGGTDRAGAFLWKPDGTELLRVPTWGTDRGSRFVWSPDGDHFLTVNGQVVLLWSKTGEILKQIPVDFTVFECEWSPDGERIAIVTDDKQLVMMSPEGELLERGSFQSIGELCWAPNSQTLAIADRGYVSIFDQKANQLTRYQSTQFKSTWNCFCFSPNGQQHRILKIDKSIAMHDAMTGKLLKYLEEEVPRLTAVDWNKHKKQLLAANHTHEFPFGIFDQAGIRQTEVPKLKMSGYDAAWNPANDDVLLGDWNLVRFGLTEEDSLQFKPAENLDRVEYGYRRIAVHPEGAFIAGTGMNNPVRILDSKGKLVRDLNLGREVFAMKFSPNGQWLAVNTNAEGVTLFDTTTWQKHREIKEPNMYGVDWSSDSSKIVTMISRGPVKIFDLEGELQEQFEPDWRVGRNQSYIALAWSPDDRWVVSSRDIDLQAYNVKTKERRQFPFHVDLIVDVVWISPTEVVIAARDGTLSCYDVESGECRWITLVLQDRAKDLKTVTFSKSGEILHMDPGAESMLIEIKETAPFHFETAPFSAKNP